MIKNYVEMYHGTAATLVEDESNESGAYLFILGGFLALHLAAAGIIGIHRVIGGQGIGTGETYFFTSLFEAPVGTANAGIDSLVVGGEESEDERESCS